MKFILVLPAYNEENSLPGLLDNVRSAFSQMDHEASVLIVDDGSRDRTVEVAEKYSSDIPITIFKHGVNKGLGAAVKNGFKEAMKQLSDEDVIITMDADNTHTPAQIPNMLTKISRGFDLVIASRYAPGGDEVGLSFFRKIMSRSASTFLKAVFGIPGARDCSCGYRAYRVGFLRKGFQVFGDNLVEQTGFVCMAEVLVKLSMMGAKIGEVPMVLRYDLKGGASKMNVKKTIRQYFALALRKGEFRAIVRKAS